VGCGGYVAKDLSQASLRLALGLREFLIYVLGWKKLKLLRSFSVASQRSY
jgi:hypothetical protein